MRRLLRSLAAVAVAAAASGALVVGLAGAASAQTAPPWEPLPNPPEAGSLLFFNAAGQQITGGTLSSAPLAAYVEGTATLRAGDTKATLFGYTPVLGQAAGTWSGEQLSASTAFPNTAAPGALGTTGLPLVTGSATDESLSTYIADFPNSDTSTTDGYGGVYVLRLVTSANGLSDTSSYDSADILVSGTTWSVEYPTITPTSTSTSLTTTQSSPQVSGTSVTLNATVTPAAPGSVQFEEGSTDIGSPVAVTDGTTTGTASISTSTLPVGDDTLSAVFTPAQFADYATSTGTASFTISPAPAANTTTALAVDPSTAPADTSVTISATVSQTSDSTVLASGAGQVSFYDDGPTDTSGDINSNSILLGTEPVGTGGVASLAYSSFATGVHNLVAQFEPTNSALYNSSISPALAFTATAPAVAPASQTIDVGIPAGSLTITTPYSSTNPFQLGTAVLDPTDSKFTATAPFGSATDPAAGVTITDTRAGDLPWTASATVTSFTDGTGDIINGQNLTFTDVTPSYIAGNALQSGDVVTTNVTNTAIYGPTASGSDGLGGGSHAFATAAAGAGSVDIDGVLTLVAPTSTPAGTYTATLTFTIS